MHVTLPELSGKTAGGGVFVAIKDVVGNDASLEVRTEIANESVTAKALNLRTVLETAEGRELLREDKAVDLAQGELRQVAQDLAPRNVRLWHPDHPDLHFIRTDLIEGGKVVDTLRTRFGIRLFEMRVKDGLFVNKMFIGAKLNGVNRHQDYAHVGNALPNSGQWRDVKLLREGGVNMVRAAHYPQDPAFYDACDEFGMLVTSANPGWQFYNDKDPVFERRVYEDTRNLVRRDRNHPSLLLWETALNETPNQPGHLLGEMHRIAHEEYPFPGLFTVADVDEAKKGGLDVYYHGGFDEPRNSFTREYGDGGEVDNFYSQNATTRVKREWGEGPLLEQAVIRAHDLDEVYATPPVRIGAALWCGIDHQRGYHPDPFWGGLLDGSRVPRYTYELFRSQYPPDYKLPGIVTGPMVRIAHELTQVSGGDVVVYSNCEEVRLSWLGRGVATRKPDAAYRSLPHPPFTFKNVFDFAKIKRDWRDPDWPDRDGSGGVDRRESRGPHREEVRRAHHRAVRDGRRCRHRSGGGRLRLRSHPRDDRGQQGRTQGARVGICQLRGRRPRRDHHRSFVTHQPGEDRVRHGHRAAPRPDHSRCDPREGPCRWAQLGRGAPRLGARPAAAWL